MRDDGPTAKDSLSCASCPAKRKTGRNIRTSGGSRATDFRVRVVSRLRHHRSPLPGPLEEDHAPDRAAAFTEEVNQFFLEVASAGSSRYGLIEVRGQHAALP